MASADTLIIFTPQAATFPTALFATFDERSGCGAGALVLDFDAATGETAFFQGFMPRNYTTGGITITVVWSASSAAAAETVWRTRIERGEAGANLASGGFGTAITATDSATATQGTLYYHTNAHTHGAQTDSTVKGEIFTLAVTRLASDSGDDMAGDAELVRVEIQET